MKPITLGPDGPNPASVSQGSEPVATLDDLDPGVARELGAAGVQLLHRARSALLRCRTYAVALPALQAAALVVLDAELGEYSRVRRAVVTGLETTARIPGFVTDWPGGGDTGAMEFIDTLVLYLDPKMRDGDDAIPLAGIARDELPKACSCDVEVLRLAVEAIEAHSPSPTFGVDVAPPDAGDPYDLLCVAIQVGVPLAAICGALEAVIGAVRSASPPRPSELEHGAARLRVLGAIAAGAAMSWPIDVAGVDFANVEDLVCGVLACTPRALVAADCDSNGDDCCHRRRASEAAYELAWRTLLDHLPADFAELVRGAAKVDGPSVG